MSLQTKLNRCAAKKLKSHDRLLSEVQYELRKLLKHPPSRLSYLIADELETALQAVKAARSKLAK